MFPKDEERKRKQGYDKAISDGGKTVTREKKEKVLDPWMEAKKYLWK